MRLVSASAQLFKYTVGGRSQRYASMLRLPHLLCAMVDSRAMLILCVRDWAP